jgi:hypothetical protein
MYEVWGYRCMLLVLFIFHVFLFLYCLVTDTYPLPLICIHIISLFVLLGWLLKSVQVKKIDAIIVVILFILAFALRIYRVDQITPGMWGDEVGYAVLGEQLVDSGKFVPFSDDLFAPPLHFCIYWDLL